VKAISYKITKQGQSVRVDRSDGYSVTKSDASILDAFLLDPADNCSQFMFYLDKNIGHILKLLGTQTKKNLYKDKRTYYSPYILFYQPDKIFSVKLGTNESNIYELAQWFPDANPQTVEEVQKLADELLEAFKQLKLTVTNFTSPARILQDCVLKHLDLPSGIDGKSAPDEVMEWAYMQGARTWIEAHQLGHFTENVYDYDISSAYPYSATRQIDTRHCHWRKEEYVPKEAYYGFLKGRVCINPEVLVSPLIYRDPETRELSNRVGEWEDTITLQMAEFIDRWKIGSFRLAEGWFGIPRRISYPLEHTMRKLYNSRKIGGLASKIAKDLAVSYWGLTGQLKDYKGVFGDYFMPIYRSDIADRTTIRVAEFSYKMKIKPIQIGVDGVLCQTKVNLGENGFGKWRLSGTEPAIVVGSDKVWQGNKHPENLHYTEVLKMMKKNPSASMYGPIAIDEPRDRVFIPHPQTGKDILEKKWNSRPLAVHEKESL